MADVLGNLVVRLTGTKLTRLARVEFAVEVALDPRGGIAVVEEEERPAHLVRRRPDGLPARRPPGSAATAALYATDYGSNLIVRIDSVGGMSPVAFADGPNSVAVDADHVIYGTERTHPWVLRVDASGTTRLPRSKD